jgi:hypothetical protein
MTLAKFQALDPRTQVTLVLMRGTYLAYRWENEEQVRLFYLRDGVRGFFVEPGQDAEQPCAVVVRSFSDSETLADYVHGVRLPWA